MNNKTEQTPTENKVDVELMKVSEEIQAILTANEMALQPFLVGYPYQLTPTVKLVRTNETSNDNKATDTGEVDGDRDSVGVANSK